MLAPVHLWGGCDFLDSRALRVVGSLEHLETGKDQHKHGTGELFSSEARW